MMTDEQRQRAAAWETVFPTDSPHTQVVLDDLQSIVDALPEHHQAGAARLIIFILVKRGQLRRSSRSTTKGVR